MRRHTEGAIWRQIYWTSGEKVKPPHQWKTTHVCNYTNLWGLVTWTLDNRNNPWIFTPIKLFEIQSNYGKLDIYSSYMFSDKLKIPSTFYPFLPRTVGDWSERYIFVDTSLKMRIDLTLWSGLNTNVACPDWTHALI